MSDTDRSQEHAQYERLKTRLQAKKKRQIVLNSLVDQVCEELVRLNQGEIIAGWRTALQRLFDIGWIGTNHRVGKNRDYIENVKDYRYIRKHLVNLLKALRDPLKDVRYLTAVVRVEFDWSGSKCSSFPRMKKLVESR